MREPKQMYSFLNFRSCILNNNSGMLWPSALRMGLQRKIKGVSLETSFAVQMFYSNISMKTQQSPVCGLPAWLPSPDTFSTN